MRKTGGEFDGGIVVPSIRIKSGGSLTISDETDTPLITLGTNTGKTHIDNTGNLVTGTGTTISEGRTALSSKYASLSGNNTFEGANIFSGNLTANGTNSIDGFSKTGQDSTYLKSTDAANTYAPKADYLTTATANSTYLKSTDAVNTYALKADYLTTATASSTYLTKDDAVNYYAPLTNPTFTGTVTINPEGTRTGSLRINGISSTNPGFLSINDSSNSTVPNIVLGRPTSAYAFTSKSGQTDVQNPLYPKSFIDSTGKITGTSEIRVRGESANVPGVLTAYGYTSSISPSVQFGAVTQNGSGIDVNGNLSTFGSITSTSSANNIGGYTKTGQDSNYLKTGDAANTYAPKSSPTFTGNVTIGANGSLTINEGTTNNPLITLGKATEQGKTYIDSSGNLVTGINTSITEAGTSLNSKYAPGNANYALRTDLDSYLTTANASSTYAPKNNPTFVGNVKVQGNSAGIPGNIILYDGTANGGVAAISLNNPGISTPATCKSYIDSNGNITGTGTLTMRGNGAGGILILNDGANVGATTNSTTPGTLPNIVLGKVVFVPGTTPSGTLGKSYIDSNGNIMTTGNTNSFVRRATTHNVAINGIGSSIVFS
jgi:hypothetical protein